MIKRSYYKEKIKKVNLDTITEEKENKISSSIIEFLYNIGEKSAALFLEKKEEKNLYSDNYKEYKKIEDRNNKEVMKLSMINSGILEKLDKIEKNMIDEQNTSVSGPLKKEKEKEKKDALTIIKEEKKDESSWFSDLLGMLLGPGLLAFLGGFKDFSPIRFAIKFLELGWNWLKDKVMILIKGITAALLKPIQEIIDFMLDKLSKIPGLEDLKSKIKPKINEQSKDPKVNEVKPETKTDVKDGKISEIGRKEAKEKIGKEIEKKVVSTGAKTAAKKIPFIGLPLAAEYAFERVQEGDIVGAAMEVASGVLGTLTLGSLGAGTAASFGVDAALLTRDIKAINEAIITKLDRDDIIDKGFFGDTTVEKWDKVNELTIHELISLSEYEDLNEEDRTKVLNILYKKQLEQVKVPEDTAEFEDGVKVIFNEREILADTLLESNDKLQEFLAKNPFTENNSEQSEIEINGEKVKEVRYKDAALNDEYIKLKEKYDIDFKNYKEAKTSQLQQIEESQQIQNENITQISENTYFNPEPKQDVVTDPKSKVKSDTDFDSIFNDILDKTYKEIENIDKTIKTVGGKSLSLSPTDISNSFSSILNNISSSMDSAPTVLNYAQKDINDVLSKDYANVELPTGELVDRIKKSEKFSATAYPDEGGYSIGYGHYIKDNEQYLMNATITRQEAEVLFAKDFERHKNAAIKNIPRFNEHPKEVQDTLIDMTYNMGPEWINNWPSIKKHLEEKNYTGVKDEILKSKYARQVKGRALVNAKVFENADKTKPVSESKVSAPKSQEQTEVTSDINKLNKDNAIEQKQGQVQKVENTNRSLTQNVSTNISTTVNNVSVQQPKQEASYNLSELFGTYS